MAELQIEIKTGSPMPEVDDVDLRQRFQLALQEEEVGAVMEVGERPGYTDIRLQVENADIGLNAVRALIHKLDAEERATVRVI